MHWHQLLRYWNENGFFGYTWDLRLNYLMRQQTGTCKNARNQSVVLLWPFESVTRELIYFGWHQITSCYHLSMVASREAVKENIRCFCSLLLLSYLRVLSQSSYCVNQMRHLSSAPILQTKRQTGMKTSFIYTVFHAFIQQFVHSSLQLHWLTRLPHQRRYHKHAVCWPHSTAPAGSDCCCSNCGWRQVKDMSNKSTFLLWNGPTVWFKCS